MHTICEILMRIHSLETISKPHMHILLSKQEYVNVYLKLFYIQEQLL